MTDSRYENDVPVDDPMVVLDLMCPRWNDETVRLIERWPHSPTHVHIEHCRDFGYHEHERFLITDAVADKLLSLGWVAGTPQWGYTEMRELKVTPKGEEILWSERQRLGDFPRATEWLWRKAPGM